MRKKTLRTLSIMFQSLTLATNVALTLTKLSTGSLIKTNTLLSVFFFVFRVHVSLRFPRNFLNEVYFLSL